LGHRSIAVMLGRPVSTVRGWLRRFTARAEEWRVWFTALLHASDPMAAPVPAMESVFGDALQVLGLAAAPATRLLGLRPPWQFASAASRAAARTAAARCGWAVVTEPPQGSVE
jgi:hypothetical protein